MAKGEKITGTRASDATAATPSNGSAVADLLPDPTAPLHDAPARDADDLISEIADAQIEAMIGASDHESASNVEKSTSATELALQATQDLERVASELNDQANADLIADLGDLSSQLQAVASQAKPMPAEPIQAEASRAEPIRAEPAQTQLTQSEPPLAKPTLAEPIAGVVNTEPADSALIASIDAILDAPQVGETVAENTQPSAAQTEPTPLVAGAVMDAIVAPDAAVSAEPFAEPVTVAEAVLPVETDILSEAAKAMESQTPPAEPVVAAPEPVAAADESVPSPAPAPDPITQSPAPLPTGLSMASVLEASTSIVNREEIDALIEANAPPIVAATPEPVVVAPEAAMQAVPKQESDADAVARELAQEAALIAEHLPTIAPGPSRTVAAREKTLAGLVAVLGFVNFPIRNLSDNARETIGVIAIITLVNAMSLLLYLMIFG